MRRSVPEGHPRRMSDAKTSWRKMTDHQRRAFLVWVGIDPDSVSYPAHPAGDGPRPPAPRATQDGDVPPGTCEGCRKEGCFYRVDNFRCTDFDGDPR